MSKHKNLIQATKREDNLTKLKKQAAANALQQYSLLALKALNDCKSPAKTRLQMMRALTELAPDSSSDPYSMRKKSTSSGYTSR